MIGETDVSTDNNMDFAAIAKAMKDLNLQRDKPFSTPLEKDFHQQLNDKIQPKPDSGDEVMQDWYGGY